MKKYIVIVMLAFSAQVNALNWTKDAKVNFVRTYDGVTYSIGLVGQSCPNQKNYFYVNDRKNNNSFNTIALSSLMSGKSVRISYTLDPNGVHCFVNGIWIKH